MQRRGRGKELTFLVPLSSSIIVWRIGIQTFLFIGRPEVSISSPLGRLLHSIVSQVWGRQEEMKLVAWCVELRTYADCRH